MNDQLRPPIRKQFWQHVETDSELKSLPYPAKDAIIAMMIRAYNRGRQDMKSTIEREQEKALLG